ncbi:hypothetical protein SPHS6_02444 [Sphingobium sp. S6]|nr:hypothetical protein SPHS6_02444 [Sphingobium sp. S6]
MSGRAEGAGFAGTGLPIGWTAPQTTSGKVDGAGLLGAGEFIFFNKSQKLLTQNEIRLPCKTHKKSTRSTDFFCCKIIENFTDSAFGQFLFPSRNQLAHGCVTVEIDSHSGSYLFID